MAVDTNAHDRARVVRRYLSALDASKPGRTAAKTVETLVFRMHQIDTDLLSADPVVRLHLTQERIDLHAEYLRLTTGAEQLDELEKAFVRVARSYGDRHNISFSAWRQIGVGVEVLAKAGIVPSKPARPAAKVEEPAAEPAGEPAPAPAKKAPVKKLKAVAKKAPAAAKKTAAAKNGATRAVKKKAAEKPPAEAHLLS